MSRHLIRSASAWSLPILFLLAAFGHLVVRPSWLVVDADRPTFDSARRFEATPGNDLTRVFLPLQRYANRCLTATGALPTWDDRGFGGRPLVGNPQAGWWYPANWLAWSTPCPAALGWITIGHLALAIAGMVWLGRTLGLGVPGRIIASVGFALNPYVIAQAFEGHLPHVWSACWYPWAFDAAIRMRRGDGRAGLALPPILAMTLLTGHPQEGYYLLIALGAWVLADLARLAKRLEASRATRLALGWLGAIALTFGLVAVEWLPDALSGPFGLREGTMSNRLASRYHPMPINLLQLVNPFALGGPFRDVGSENYWESVTSTGLVVMVLALVGVSRAVDRPRIVGWAILAVGALVFAGGRKLGLFAAMYALVPGMDRFRVPSRSLFLFAIASAVLAGHGVEALGRRAGWRRVSTAWGIAATLILAAIAHSSRPGGVDGNDEPRVARHATPEIPGVDRGSRKVPSLDRVVAGFERIGRQPTFWLAAAGLTVGLAAGLVRPSTRPALALMIGLVGASELAAEGFQLLTVADPSRFLGVDPVAEMIAARGATPEGASTRIRAEESMLPDLQAVERGWSKTDIGDTYQVQAAAELYQHLYGLSRPEPCLLDRPMDGAVAGLRRQIRRAVLDRMAVDRLVLSTDDPTLLATPEWSIDASVERSGRPIALVVNRSALPRCYVVPRAEVVDASERVDLRRFLDVDPRSAVTMTADPLADVEGPRQPFTPARWASRGPDRLTIEVETDAPGLLVVADTWMPGWAARLDGRPVAIERGNRAQRVVAIPRPGPHAIEMRYEPPGLRMGEQIALASASAWVVAASVAIGSAFGPKRRGVT